MSLLHKQINWFFSDKLSAFDFFGQFHGLQEIQEVHIIHKHNDKIISKDLLSGSIY